MSINSKLSLFAREQLVLGRKDEERRRIQLSIDTLKRRLMLSLNQSISEIIPFGSYTRNTILPRVYDANSDIDLLVIFNCERTPQTFRHWIKSALQPTYAKSQIYNNFPTVTMELEHIVFDLVPCIVKHSLWQGTKFYIPDNKSEWMETDPHDIKFELEEANTRYPNNIVRQIVRLCKHWNCAAGYPLQSYLMEKRLVRLNYYSDDLFSGFIFAIEQIAGNNPGVAQALDFIDKYKHEENEDKILFWLKKLLPGLSQR